ncbi:MAG: sulfatase [Planctomycetota bacterium]
MTHINRREFLRKCTGAGFALWSGTVAAGGVVLSNRALEIRRGRRPNIVAIISDDMGYADLGCHGGTDIPTPNIDSIAAKGIRFTNGYVSCPVCSPTRAGLTTGRYQQRFGHEFNTGPPPGGLRDEVGLPLTEITIADVLKSAGYVTGMVGKWHLGLRPHFHPLRRGYDEFFGFLHGGHSYIDPGLGTFNPILRGTEEVDEQEYLTDALSREAVAFVERHRKRPFFLYLAYNAVHTPMQAPQRYQDSFGHIEDATRRTYAGMLAAMDDGVGEVLAKLRESGLEENTLLFFVNDNGGSGKNGSNDYPLRGKKGSMWEGGIRVPFMVQWPSRLQRGVTYDNPVIALDILPTAAAAGGAEPPGDRVIDGVNLLPYLTGRSEAAPHETLFWRRGTDYAMRKGKWKLTHEDGASELFDLESDISEEHNLAGEQRQVLEELEGLYAKWDSEMVEPMWYR